MGTPARAFEPKVFTRPDFARPVDVGALLALGPPEGEVKGMFFARIAGEARARGADVGRDRYTPFRGYPLREWLELLPAAARAVHPGVPAREGMRRFGHDAYGVFARSMAGRVLFSLAGLNVEMAVRLCGRAFDVIGSHGKVEVVHVEPGRAELALRGMWDYVDSWHVGIYEGALKAFGAKGEVRVRVHDHANGDIEIRW